jgi:hypothetical protein
MRLLQGTIIHLTAAATLPLLLAIVPARAQQPTAAQISAIRSSCRSDFMANCSGVQPGSRDALQCLQRNVAKLSPSCKSAVAATMPEPAKPAAAAPPPPPAAAAPAPVSAADVNHPAPAPAAQPPAHAAPVASQPRSGVEARRPLPGQPAKPAPAAAEAKTPAPEQTVAPLHVRSFIMPQRRVVIVAICGADVRTLCAGVPPGGERVLKCLAAQAGRLSPPCYNAIARVSRD